jgi:hypothetical protein
MKMPLLAARCSEQQMTLLVQAFLKNENAPSRRQVFRKTDGAACSDLSKQLKCPFSPPGVSEKQMALLVQTFLTFKSCPNSQRGVQNNRWRGFFIYFLTTNATHKRKLIPLHRQVLSRTAFLFQFLKKY